jgi:hypothetical protein
MEPSNLPSVADCLQELSSGGPRSRWEAIQALANSTDPEAHTELILNRITERLGDGHSIVRHSAGYGLIRFGGFRTVLNALYHSDANVRYGAAEALDRYGPHIGVQVEDPDFGPLPVSRIMYEREYFEAMYRLVALLSDDTVFSSHQPYEHQTTVAESAAHTLARWRNLVELPPGRYEGLGCLWKALAETIRRLHAIDTLDDMVEELNRSHVFDLDITIGPGWQLKQSGGTVKALRDQHVQIRQVTSMGRTKAQAAGRCNYSPVICACAARLLSKWSSRQVVDTLTGALKRGHDLVRCAAAHALAQLAPRLAFEAVREAADDQAVHVSFAAVEALVAIDPSLARDFIRHFVQRRPLMEFLAHLFRPSSFESPSMIKRAWAAKWIR